jgi:hypothetical protein
LNLLPKPAQTRLIAAPFEYQSQITFAASPFAVDGGAAADLKVSLNSLLSSGLKSSGGIIPDEFSQS